MLVVSECIARSALIRQESRGGHTRDDYPGMNAEWRRKLLISTIDGDGIAVLEQASPAIRPDLLALFERSELEKYLTADELVGFVGTEEPPAGTASGGRA